MRVALARTFALICWAMLCAAPAQAHEVGLSRGVWLLDGAHVVGELVFSASEVNTLHLTPALVASLIHVDNPRGACLGTVDGDGLVEADGHAMRLVFNCNAAARTTVDVSALLARLSNGHRHLGTANANGHVHQFVLDRYNSALSFGETSTPTLTSYLRMGVEHILAGYDHLAFLLGLLWLGGRLRQLLLTVSAFTLAHSASLALTVFGVTALSPSMVEPMIAASVMYVGAENFFSPAPKSRAWLAAVFGFIHGFGFAGALSEIGLPQADRVPALLLFNLGVELGQIAVLLAVVPFGLWLLRRQPKAHARLTILVNSGLVVLGGYYLVERLVG